MTVSITKSFHAKEVMLGECNYIEDDIRIAFMKRGYRPGNDYVSFSQAQGMEVESQLHYPSGGLSLQSKHVDTDDDGIASLYCGTVKVASFAASMEYAVIYANISTSNIVQPILFTIYFGEVLVFEHTMFMLSWPEPLVRW